jgi:hypothetical protein
VAKFFPPFSDFLDRILEKSDESNPNYGLRISDRGLRIGKMISDCGIKTVAGSWLLVARCWLLVVLLT